MSPVNAHVPLHDDTVLILKEDCVNHLHSSCVKHLANRLSIWCYPDLVLAPLNDGSAASHAFLPLFYCSLGEKKSNILHLMFMMIDRKLRIKY